jgi:cell wall assembly regulator SMI1
MIRRGVLSGVFEGWACDPQGPIQPVRWSECWIPIASEGSGDYLCIDMCPVPGGDIGQVIYVDQDVGPVKVLAKGFGEFLTAFADDLENGKFRIDGRLQMIVRRDGQWLYSQV